MSMALVSTQSFVKGAFASCSPWHASPGLFQQKINDSLLERSFVGMWLVQSLKVMTPVAVGVFSTLLCIHEEVVGHITVVGTQAFL